MRNDAAATGAITIDARGLKCPLPVLKLETAIAEAPEGASLLVLASDPVARIDIPLFCRQNGHGCAVHEAGGHMRFEIVKAAGAAGE